MERKQLLYWIWLSLALEPASRAAAPLLEAFGDAYKIYAAKKSELEKFPDLYPKAKRALGDKSLERAARVLDLCEQNGISLLAYTDENFPDALRTVKRPPVLLYYRGHLPDWNRNLCVAVVGTRSMSEYGMHSAYRISYEIAAGNAVVVSGMAKGIDGVASAAAIAGGGDTVVFLGCGIDVLYPKCHRALRDEICAHGAIVSEYPPKTLPLSRHFPERNRLIAGASQATLAIEGDEESGALITAREALSEGRAVYALPGDVDRERSKGMNLLLDEGAYPLLSAAAVLQSFLFTHWSLFQKPRSSDVPKTDTEYLKRLGVLKTPRREKRAEKHEEESCAETAESSTQNEIVLSEELLSSLTPVQTAIVQCIVEKGSICADGIYSLPYSYGEISAALTQLEVKRIVKRLPGSEIGLV